MGAVSRRTEDPILRGQSSEAKSLRLVAQETTKLWRKHHLTYDQTKQVVAQTRRALQLSAPRTRRRTVERLDRTEVGALIDDAYRRSSCHGLMVKTLFYTGARVSEFVHIQVTDLYLSLDPPRFTWPRPRAAAMGMCPSYRPSPRSCRPTWRAGGGATSSRVIGATSTQRATSNSWCMRQPPTPGS